ncbi:MAG: hypothetical protein HY597_07445 [Candidatus Omnitrophica bacterium]|nr:hypothetical protein [Candidatus Omnitrophota bacterium]
MNVRTGLTVLLAAGLCALSATRLTAEESSQPTLPKATYVSPQTVKAWLAEGRDLLFIDVRQPKEYAAGHIEDAINLPYDQVEAQTDEFPRDVPVILYCIHSSWRGPYAANALADRGVTNVYILEGGIVAWKAGGQTIRVSQAGRRPRVAPYPKGLRIALKHPEAAPTDQKLLLTLDELQQFDGRDGRSAYVALKGKIYDVTQSRLWRGGVHDPSHGLAMAGRDLTSIIDKSPHGVKELKKFPVVGRLVTEERE